MEHVLHLLISRYGYIGLSLSLALGIVGIPVPDETLLTYAGYLTSKGNLILPLVILSAFIGATIGITASYGIGARWGLPFLLKYGPKIHISHRKIESAQRWMNKYGNILLFIGFFVPGLRHLTAYLAGMSRLQLRTFMIYAYSGALVWSCLFIYVGYMLGNQWVMVKYYVHHYGFTLLFYAALAALIIVVYRQLFMKKVKA
ncbi:alkaline phosphatase [Paenibacillus baekrokdamisoli]|uniref:Alkaline phosphatase n=1 Tax=Paenibacillus baekrokdamisoli TaxID=1712516 RepID=A0A3G9J2L3_9BACL|nr:DedA family protein [Paenibacillus baekrokdamisoli]MBB3072649.1 membrane protein DedA with SNARE-associated domain [Paenibacillus baekrokdamisoli]BBH18933.1 alkaline phosphatase [Paenibacillus baekrokdamisoli]